MPLEQTDIQSIRFMGVNDYIFGGGNIINLQRREDSYPAFFFGKYGIVSIRYSSTNQEDKSKRFTFSLLLIYLELLLQWTLLLM